MDGVTWIQLPSIHLLPASLLWTMNVGWTQICIGKYWATFQGELAFGTCLLIFDCFVQPLMWPQRICLRAYCWRRWANAAQLMNAMARNEGNFTWRLAKNSHFFKKTREGKKTLLQARTRGREKKSSALTTPRGNNKMALSILCTGTATHKNVALNEGSNASIRTLRDTKKTSASLLFVEFLPTIYMSLSKRVDSAKSGQNTSAGYGNGGDVENRSSGISYTGYEKYGARLILVRA